MLAIESEFVYKGTLKQPTYQLARRRSLITLLCAVVGVMLSTHLNDIFAIQESSDMIVIVVLLCLSLIGLCGAVLVSSLSNRHRVSSAFVLLSVICVIAAWTHIRTSPSIGGKELDSIVREFETSSAEKGSAHIGSFPLVIEGMILETVQRRVRPDFPGRPPMWEEDVFRTRMLVHRVEGRIEHPHGGHTPLALKAQGSIYVYLDQEFADELKAGDHVRVLGMYSLPSARRNIGDLDWDRLSEQSNRVGSIRVQSIEHVEHLTDQEIRDRVGSGVGGVTAAIQSNWIQAKDFIRQRAKNAIGFDSESQHASGLSDSSSSSDSESASNVSGRSTGMLGAILLGHRDPAFGEMYQRFQRVGVAHVLAISGFHLAICILIVMGCIRFFGDYPKLELIAILCMLLFVIMVIPLRPPIMRASLIVIAILIGNRFGRQFDRMTILSWVGVGLILWRPMDVYSLGYQLSMGVTGLLVMWPQSHRPRRFVAHQKFPAWKRVCAHLGWRTWSLMKVNIGCWMFAFPMILVHIGGVSLLSPVASFILIPLIVLVMILGYVQIAVGMLVPSVAEQTRPVVQVVSEYVIDTVSWIDTLELSWVRVEGFSGTLAWVWAVIACVIIWIGIVGPRSVRWFGARVLPLHDSTESRSKLKRKWFRVSGVGCALFGGALLMGLGVANPWNGRSQAMSHARIDMVDVGDGTCMIVSSKGESIIWDCGSLNWQVDETAWRVIRDIGLRKVRGAVVTHDNIDHFNGLIGLTTHAVLDRVWVSEWMATKEVSYAWRQTRDILVEQGVEIVTLRQGDTIEFGELSAECVWPPLFSDLSQSETDALRRPNNRSMVMHIKSSFIVESQNHEAQTRSSQGASIMLCGDIEHEAMNHILQLHSDLRVDVMEAPHHGSGVAQSDDFIGVLNPQIVLQSTGAQRVGDSRIDMSKRGRLWYCSALLGGAWVEVDQHGTIQHGWAVGGALGVGAR